MPAGRPRSGGNSARMTVVQPRLGAACLLFLAVWTVACASGSPPVEPAFTPSTSITYSHDGARLLVFRPAAVGCVLLTLDSATGTELNRESLPGCVEEPERTAGRKVTVPDMALRDVRLLDRENLLVGVLTVDGGESLVRISEAGEVTSLIPETVREIDSFDVSPDQKELVVSARRGDSFDVALGSTASASVRWVAADRLDEVMVSWAPRGSKVTYLVKAAEGSLLRTLHVPTGYELMIDLPHMSVSQLAWEPKAERFAVVVSGPGISTSIMTMAYGGEDRRTLVPAEHRASIEMEPFAWAEGSGWAIRPARVGYGATYPVIVWTGVKEPFAWDARRGASHMHNEAVSILVAERIEGLTPAFWSAVRQLPLADLSRILVVDPSGERRPGATLPAGASVVDEAEVPLDLRATHARAAGAGESE